MRNDGGQRHARHTKAEHDDKDKIEDHVDDAGRKQKIERTACITDGPQQRRAEVICDKSRHAEKIDAHIDDRQIDHIFRRSHPFQQRTCQQISDEDHEDPADDRDADGGVDRLPRVLFIPCPAIARHQHIAADRDAQKQIDEQIDQRTGGTNGRQCLTAGKPADHDDVRRIEEQLQDT